MRRILLAIAAMVLICQPAEAADDLTRPIRVSPDGRFLTQPDGAPFFWLGDTAWALFTRLTLEEAKVYFDDRAAKGFNVVQIVAAGTPWDRLNAPNRYGELPFVDGDPSRPNPKFFEHVDRVVEAANRRGVRIAMLPLWGLDDVSHRGNASPIYTPRNARTYGEWLGTRYRDKGVIWVLGGDTIPVWPRTIKQVFGEPEATTLADGKIQPSLELVDHRPVYDALAAGIETAQPDAFITYHPCPHSFSGAARPRTSLYFHDRSWLDMNMLQSSHFADPSNHLRAVRADFAWIGPRNYEAVAEEYASIPVRPIIDGEPRYEFMTVDIAPYNPGKGIWSTYDTRNAAYHAVFAGAAGHTFGNTSVHISWDASLRESDKKLFKFFPMMGGTWREQLNSPGARQMRHLKALVLSRPYFVRVPDQSMIVGDAGDGTGHISATRARDGSYAFVYIPDGRPITLDLTGMSGQRLAAWWYDPRTGLSKLVASPISEPTQRTFSPPSRGPEEDWVLVLDDAGRSFGPPGQSPM